MRPLPRRVLYGIVVGSVLFAPVMGEPPCDTPAYVQKVTEDGVKIRKCTPVPREFTLRVVDAASAALVHDERGPARVQHLFRVRGLQSGRGYQWRLHDTADDGVHEHGEFRTPSADDRAPVRFALLGDSGGQPWWCKLRTTVLVHSLARCDLLAPNGIASRIAAAAAAAKPDFWLHLGDVIYPSAVHGSWTAGFFAPFAPLLRTSPCYVTLGNHDLIGDDGHTVLDTFHLPQNRVTRDERMYSFAWGPVRTIVVDTNDAPGAADLAFLRAALAAASEPWLVVCGHHPMRSVSRGGDRRDLLRQLQPELARAGVDLYLCGHDHNYQRCELAPGLWHVVSGGGG
jgi:hypothetical protein